MAIKAIQVRRRTPTGVQLYVDFAPDERTAAMNYALLAREFGIDILEVKERLQWLYRNLPEEQGP